METTIQKLVALVVVSLFLVWVLTTLWRRKKRDKVHWQNWNKVVELLKREYGCRMFRILDIRQHASTGTKAFAVFEDTSEQNAIWIPDFWPTKGEYIVSKGDYGYGSHHDENVYYVKQVLLRLHKDTYKGWKRYEKRLKKVEAGVSDSRF